MCIMDIVNAFTRGTMNVLELAIRKKGIPEAMMMMMMMKVMSLYESEWILSCQRS